MSQKVGLYVCDGCSIGQCVDTQQLLDNASSEYSPSVAAKAEAYCLEGRKQIEEDIEKEGLDAVVIAACSPRVNTDVFTFGKTRVERANLREFVAWTHKPQDEETQALAQDYISMSMVRAKQAEPAEPYTEANERRLLVVGGGPAGLSAAIHAAQAGTKVLLVEKAAELGGYGAKLHKEFPTEAPFTDLRDSGMAAYVEAAKALADITVMTNTSVDEIKGQPGKFEATLTTDGSTKTETVGAVVMATGWVEGDVASYEHYGLGKLKNVVSSVELEKMASNGGIKRPSDGGKVKTAAVVVCDAVSDEQHRPYGGNVSSMVALKQALYIREQNPDAVVYVFASSMQTPGQYEYFYKRAQLDEGLLFSRGEVSSVAEGSGGRVTLDVNDTVLGGPVTVDLDLLVVSTDMVPTSRDEEAHNLNLVYLQGKEAPTTDHGFVNSNFICFPYETRRTAIYSAGAVRKSMDMANAMQDGAGAAMKALQSIEKSTLGQAVHPRVGELTFPRINPGPCTQCGRCTQECPFGAIELNEEKRPVVSPNRCRRCGTCMGACPVQTISFADYSVPILSQMIKSIEIPEDDDEKTRILVLACENDAYPALDMAAMARLEMPAAVRVLPVRCLGSVNAVLAADAVSAGFDAVALMGCKSGDDYQCHFIRGSELLGTRMEKVRDTLEGLALEAERVQLITTTIADAEKIPDILGKVTQVVEDVGPNPMKGF